MADLYKKTRFAADKCKFRVIGVDTFDGDDWEVGDFDNFEDAKIEAEKKVANGQQMLKMHIYDDAGTHLHECGLF